MKGKVNGEFVTVIAVMGLGVLAISMLQPILPLYLTSINVSPDILGLMFSVAMVGMVFGESYWGWIADRIGLKLPLITGTTVCGLFILCFIFTRNITAIFLIFLLWGVVRSALFGPGRGYIATIAPPFKKATFMAIISVMLSASRSLGALPSGILSDKWGYHSVFYVSCGVALLGGFVVAIGLKNMPLTVSKPFSGSSSRPGKFSFEMVISLYHALASQCLVATCQFFVLGIMMTFLPLLATQVVGVSATEVGILFTVGGLVVVVLGIPMGMFADRMGKKSAMILGLLLAAVAMTGMAFVKSFFWLLVFVIIRGISMALFNPAALGLLSDSVPLDGQSTVMGFYGGVCENTGVIAGSALGGFIWSTLGPEATFLSGTMAAVMGTLICIVFVKRKGSAQ